MQGNLNAFSLAGATKNTKDHKPWMDWQSRNGHHRTGLMFVSSDPILSLSIRQARSICRVRICLLICLTTSSACRLISFVICVDTWQLLLLDPQNTSCTPLSEQGEAMHIALWSSVETRASQPEAEPGFSNLNHSVYLSKFLISVSLSSS